MKFLKFFVIICFFLLVARVALPYALISFAEYRINKIPEYRVKIHDLDVHLYRGSYTIKDISLFKVNKNIPVPFFSAKAIDLSVQWRALLHGSLVAKIIAYQPTINFVIDPNKGNEQLSIDKEWEHAVKSLFPLNFNYVQVVDGKLAFRNFNGKPPFNLFLKNVQFTMENLQKVDKGKDLLSSSFTSTANTMDGAKVFLDGKFDPFSKSPTFLMKGELKSMEINKTNDFLRHFTNIDVSKGKFSLYVEAAAARGKIKGYAKPIVRDLKILNPNKPMDPIEFLYKGALELASKIVTNHQQQTIATKINIEGQLDEPDTSTLSIIGYMLRHAFLQALLPRIDNTIHMKDVLVVGKR